MSSTERRYIVDLLESDLYERINDRHPSEGMTWRSPLGHYVRITGSRTNPIVQVWHYDQLLYGPDYCTAEELDRILP